MLKLLVGTYLCRMMIKCKVYVDGTALTPGLNLRSIVVYERRTFALRLNTKRELMMDGESMKMELVFVDRKT